MDVHLLRMLSENDSSIGAIDSYVEVIDVEEYDGDWRVEFAPLYGRGSPMNPVIGFWENDKIVWVEYGFDAAAVMLKCLGLPKEELLRRMNVIR